eukprot:6491235-Amphidinium_carterae.2
MHTCALGVVQQYLSGLLWEVMCMNVFKADVQTVLDVQQYTLSVLDSKLQAWYGTVPESSKVSRIDALKIEALGSYDSQTFSYKAADTIWFLRFMHSVGLADPGVANNLEGWEDWTKGAELLVYLWDALNGKGRVVSGNELQDLPVMKE